MKALLLGISVLALQSALSTGAVASPPVSAPVQERPSFAEPSLSPDGSMIAFVSGGDIWEVPASGGDAHLLVSDNAADSRPLYSPDGRRLAFTSTRDGAANIYVLDLATGHTERLTWSDSGEELDSWSRDGKWIYFASGAANVGREADIFRVAAEGGTPLQVSHENYLPQFQASPSPDGTRIAVMAQGLSNVQWWRNGHAHIDETSLWLKSIGSKGGYQRLLAPDAKHAWPMWTPDGAAIVYMSDQSGAENLWQLSLAPGATPRQLTHFTDGRLLFPAMAANGSGIVFERGFAIWRYDIAKGNAAPVGIALRGAKADTPEQHLSLTRFSALAVAPDGKKVAMIAHGELFAVPTKDGGPAQRITRSEGAETQPTWSPDSRRLLYVAERGLSQRLAEYDVAAMKETLLSPPGQVAGPVYSPDGKSAVYVFNDRELHLVSLPRDGKPASDHILFTGAVAQSWTDNKPVWSPDGRYVAFPVVDGRSFVNVYVVPAAGGEARPVSFLANGEMGGMAWSPDGKYILFGTSQRSEDSKIVRIDLTPHVPKYREDQFRDLFKPATTPAAPSAGTEASKPADGETPAAKPAATPVEIDWTGLRDRATILPLGLSARDPVISADGKTLVFHASVGDADNLYSYDLDELAAEPAVAKQISATGKPKGNFALTSDGKTLFYLDDGTIFSTPLAEPKPKRLDATAAMDVDFADEKQVVFDEAWSELNEHFFDPHFNGKDWSALRERFAPYAAGARTPAELRRIINLMIGELNSSHSGINPPRPGSADHIGALGLSFDREASESGHGLVVSEVVRLGPADVEGHIHPGDRIVSLDGTAIGLHTNLYSLLESKIGKLVVLGVEDAKGAPRTVQVKPVPLAVDARLRYRAWVDSRRALVDRLSGGKLGYVHLIDMSSESLDQLYLDLDAENEGKQGVVVDVRNNNGGFINGNAIDVFARQNYLRMTPRGLFTMPARQMLGQRALGLPTVLVTNESSLSDSEDFTEGYRALKLGKVVGEPTAGWIIFTGGTRLIDGSMLRLPSIRVQDMQGQDMEMHPRPVDVEVARPLGETATGSDAQLAAAVQTLLEQIGSPQPSRP